MAPTGGSPRLSAVSRARHGLGFATRHGAQQTPTVSRLDAFSPSIPCIVAELEYGRCRGADEGAEDHYIAAFRRRDHNRDRDTEQPARGDAVQPSPHEQRMHKADRRHDPQWIQHKPGAPELWPQQRDDNQPDKHKEADGAACERRAANQRGATLLVDRGAIEREVDVMLKLQAALRTLRRCDPVEGVAALRAELRRCCMRSVDISRV